MEQSKRGSLTFFNIKIKSHKLSHCCPGEGFKGFVVNRTYHSIKEGSQGILGPNLGPFKSEKLSFSSV